MHPDRLLSKLPKSPRRGLVVGAALALTAAGAACEENAQQPAAGVAEGVGVAEAPAAEIQAQPPLLAEPDPELGGVLIETGVASTYGEGDDFQGNVTACGQVFDTYLPSVAHKTLPCGTMLRVESIETGRSVLVEVMDRGPFTPGRTVDLSMAAYRQIAPYQEPGLLDVHVYRMPDKA